MTAFRKAFPGDDVNISRSAFNRVTDMVQTWTVHEQDATRKPPMPPSRGRSGGIVDVVNGTGGDVDAEFGVACISDVPIKPDDNQEEYAREPLFTVETPTDTNLDKFVILQSPAASGDIVSAVVQGVTICKVHVIDAQHEYAKPIADQVGYLDSAADGPVRILWKAEGTGEQWATVLVRGGDGGAKPYLLAEAVTYPPDGPPYTTGWPAIPSGTDDPSWYVDEEAEPVKLWYNGAPTDADGYFLGVPIYGYGKWVWAQRVNGLLEIQAPHEPAGPYLVELDADLPAGGDSTGTLVLPEEMEVEEPPSIPIHDDILTEPEGEEEPETIPAGKRLKVMWSDIHLAFTPMVESCAEPPEPEA